MADRQLHHPTEAHLLTLDARQAEALLHWTPLLDLERPCVGRSIGPGAPSMESRRERVVMEQVQEFAAMLRSDGTTGRSFG